MMLLLEQLSLLESHLNEECLMELMVSMSALVKYLTGKRGILTKRRTRLVFSRIASDSGKLNTIL